MSKESPQPEHDESSIERWPMGRSIMHRLRGRLNDPDGPFPGAEHGIDVFHRLYLESRDSCIPDEFIGDEILDDIHSLFYFPLDALRAELKEHADEQRVPDLMLVLVDPSWEDSTMFALHDGTRIYLSGGFKAWNFWWESEDAMAEDFQDWFQRAKGVLPTWHEVEVDEEGYLVTLTMERVVHVATDDREAAISRAIDWTNNGDDDDVQLLLEEVNGYRSLRIERTDANQLDGAR